MCDELIIKLLVYCLLLLFCKLRLFYVGFIRWLLTDLQHIADDDDIKPSLFAHSLAICFKFLDAYFSVRQIICIKTYAWPSLITSKKMLCDSCLWEKKYIYCENEGKTVFFLIKCRMILNFFCVVDKFKVYRFSSRRIWEKDERKYFNFKLSFSFIWTGMIFLVLFSS